MCLGPVWSQSTASAYFVQYLCISEVLQIQPQSQIGHWPLTSVSPEGGLAEQPKAFLPEEFKSQSISFPRRRNKHRLISRLWEFITYMIPFGAHCPSDSWQVKAFLQYQIFGVSTVLRLKVHAICFLHRASPRVVLWRMLVKRHTNHRSTCRARKK